MQYTKSEMTEKKKSIGDAVNTASKIFKGPICMDAIKNRDLDEKITIVEMNEIVEQIISDSYLYK